MVGEITKNKPLMVISEGE